MCSPSRPIMIGDDHQRISTRCLTAARDGIHRLPSTAPKPRPTAADRGDTTVGRPIPLSGGRGRRLTRQGNARLVADQANVLDA